MTKEERLERREQRKERIKKLLHNLKPMSQPFGVVETEELQLVVETTIKDERFY